MRPDFYDRVAENECCRIKQDRYRCQIFLWCFPLTMKNNQSKCSLKTCRSGSIHLVFPIWSRKSTTYLNLLPVKLTCKQGSGVGGVGAMLYGVYIFINLCCLGVEQINSFLFLVWRSSRRLLAEELKGWKFCGSEVDSGLRGNKISLRSWTDETRLSCFQQIHGCGARGGNISTISFFFFYLSETAELLQIALNCDRFRLCVTPSAVVSCLTETNWQAGCCPSISSKAQHTILLFYRNLLPIRFPQGWKDGRHRVIVLFVRCQNLGPKTFWHSTSVKEESWRTCAHVRLRLIR